MAVGVTIGNRQAYQQSLLPQQDIKFKHTASCKTDGIKRLYHSDNLDVLNLLVNDENVSGKVTLIYIDPPYNTESNIIYKLV